MHLRKAYEKWQEEPPEELSHLTKKPKPRLWLRRLEAYKNKKKRNENVQS